MFFNDYEKVLMMKLRQEEIERNFQQAWRWDLPKKESLLEKVATKWRKREKESLVQTNCCCACGC